MKLRGPVFSKNKMRLYLNYIKGPYGMVKRSVVSGNLYSAHGHTRRVGDQPTPHAEALTRFVGQSSSSKGAIRHHPF